MVLEDKRQYFYNIIDTKEKVKSVVSYQLLYNLTERDGASHCQERQNETIYKLLKIRNTKKFERPTVARVRKKKEKKKKKNFSSSKIGRSHQKI